MIVVDGRTVMELRYIGPRNRYVRTYFWDGKTCRKEYFSHMCDVCGGTYFGNAKVHNQTDEHQLAVEEGNKRVECECGDVLLQRNLEKHRNGVQHDRRMRKLLKHK